MLAGGGIEAAFEADDSAEPDARLGDGPDGIANTGAVTDDGASGGGGVFPCAACLILSSKSPCENTAQVFKRNMKARYEVKRSLMVINE